MPPSCKYWAAGHRCAAEVGASENGASVYWAAIDWDLAATYRATSAHGALACGVPTGGGLGQHGSVQRRDLVILATPRQEQLRKPKCR